MNRTTGQWEALLDLVPRRTFDEETLTEIVRLRRELEQLRDRLAKIGADDSNMAHFSTVPVTPFMADMARDLTTILEGTNEWPVGVR